MREGDTDTGQWVHYDMMRRAFRGAEVERDNVILEVENIRTAASGQSDGDARFTLDVRARPVPSDAGEDGGGRDA